MSDIHNPSIVYRPEIDGLRSVAVLSVILFHAGIHLFSGGYVGVDVFFVISGFLITSIILREIAENRFSVRTFYERRMRRILPALLVVLLVTSVIAWIGMLTDELRRYGQSLFAVATFSSNVFFWRTTNYFAHDGDYPLLHTWSLSVEEQYYVLFPLFLMLCSKLGRARVLWLMLSMAVGSLALSDWGQRHYAVASFYLLPTREWELLAGSLIAFIPSSYAERLRNGTLGPQLGAIVGLTLIAYPIFGFNESTPFPGMSAAVPVLGTVLVILFCGNGGPIYRLLSSRAFVAVGLVSYSAYLWHQPVLVVLSKVVDPAREAPMFLSLALSATFLLATVSFHAIEKPFRLMQSKKVLPPAFLSLVAVIIMSVPMIYTSDSSVRPIHSVIASNAKLNYYAQWVDGRLTNEICGVKSDENGVTRCNLGADASGSPDLILWGDSLAGALAYGFDNSLKKRGLKGVAYIADGCPPVVGLSSAINTKCHNQTHSSILESIISTPGRQQVVLLGNIQFPYVNPCCTIDGSPANWSAAEPRLLEVEERLRKGGKHLVLVQQGPFFPERAAAFYLRNELFNRHDEPVRRHLEVTFEDYRRATSNLKSLKGRISYIDTDQFFCNSVVCRAMNHDGRLLVYDNTHYTQFGSDMLSEFIFRQLDSSAH